MSSVILDRHLTLETISVEQQSGVDGQGRPAYAAAVEIEARVLRQDKVVLMGDGTQQRTQLSVWVPADEDYLPVETDRITYSSEQFIVAEMKEVKDGKAQAVHRRLRCRQE
jgi:hypothetical protein